MSDAAERRRQAHEIMPSCLLALEGSLPGKLAARLAATTFAINYPAPPFGRPCPFN